MTWNEYYRYYLQQLQTIYSMEEATAIAGLVFENKAAITRMDIMRSPEELLSGHQKMALDNALEQLMTHKPVQQVTGEAWFYNLRFIVNKHVLIPRPETEELVKWIIDDNSDDVSILDIGSGSGCIPVALKKNLSQSSVTLIDVSDEALAIAKQNAVANKTTIDFLQLDFLNEKEWQRLPVFDIIVSNPPYIPLKEKEHLDRNVTAYEPGLALFVPDNKPLLFYEAIAAFAKTHLKKDGKIYVEIHEDFAKETAGVFSSVFKELAIRKDINGKERMIKAANFLP
ncbi:MAG: peptide chain release factor N(5)-glutamine methyltransferase [Bacteroidota bacterium]